MRLLHSCAVLVAGVGLLTGCNPTKTGEAENFPIKVVDKTAEVGGGSTSLIFLTDGEREFRYTMSPRVDDPQVNELNYLNVGEEVVIRAAPSTSGTYLIEAVDLERIDLFDLAKGAPAEFPALSNEERIFGGTLKGRADLEGNGAVTVCLTDGSNEFRIQINARANESWIREVQEADVNDQFTLAATPNGKGSYQIKWCDIHRLPYFTQSGTASQPAPTGS